MPNSKPFPRNLKALLDKSGLSAAQLAEKTGLSRSTIYHYLNGDREPLLSQARKIAEALECTVDDLCSTHS